MSELKPCPFCGGEAGGYLQIHCQDCNAEGPFHTQHSYEDAIAAWNRRVEPEPSPWVRVPHEVLIDLCYYGHGDHELECRWPKCQFYGDDCEVEIEQDHSRHCPLFVPGRSEGDNRFALPPPPEPGEPQEGE